MENKNSLSKNSVTFLGDFFNSLAGQAPTYSIAGGTAYILSTSYVSSPLAMLITLIGVITIVYSVIILSKRYAHSASFYYYVSKILGKSSGYFNGLIYTIFYSVVGIGSIAIAFAYLGYEGIYALTGIEINPLFLIIIPVIVAYIIAYLGIKPSIKSEYLVSLIEISILIIFIVFSFVYNSKNISLMPFTLKGTFTNSLMGELVAISGGLIFSITYFMGFEVSTQLGEESKEPNKNIPNSTLISTLIMGILYILATYAILLNIGYSYNSVNNFISEAQGEGVNPVFLLMRRYLGILGLTVFSIITLISVFGCYLATLNATSRMLYGMSKEGILPNKLSVTHKKFKSPINALNASTLMSLIAIIIFYLISLNYGNLINITYNAMEKAYAIDSLYYVISLALLSISAFLISEIKGKIISIIGLVILGITFYYSIVNVYYLITIIISSLLTILTYFLFKNKFQINI
ncbi:APC family permease [Caldisphaera sp.]|uniref:APC family permease n=1 Tax=Caldisphaera sp. TaxID=2060322 RepID=UPI0025C1C5D2|nr:APC family permease [Caldisphaera sp.]